MSRRIGETPCTGHERHPNLKSRFVWDQERNKRCLALYSHGASCTGWEKLEITLRYDLNWISTFGNAASNPSPRSLPTAHRTQKGVSHPLARTSGSVFGPLWPAGESQEPALVWYTHRQLRWLALAYHSQGWHHGAKIAKAKTS